jgi:hypothetical protein
MFSVLAALSNNSIGFSERGPCGGYITRITPANKIRQQAEVIQNHDNENVRSIGQGEALTENTRGLNLAAVKHTTVQVTRLPL